MRPKAHSKNSVVLLSGSDLERKLPVWAAFADLFLDTEACESDYEHIVSIIQKSGYSCRELENIFKKEVAPAFAFNLLGVAGVWSGWNEDEVREIVTGYLYGSWSIKLSDNIRLLLCQSTVNMFWLEVERRLK